MYKMKIGDIIYPLAPSEIIETYPNKNEAISLINSKELNLVRKPGLREYSMSFLLPRTDYPFAYYPKEKGKRKFKRVGYYKNNLTGLKKNRKAFRLIIAKQTEGTHYVKQGKKKKKVANTADTKPFAMTVTIEDLSFTESADNGTDIAVSVTFKEYVPIKTKTVVIRKSPKSSKKKSKKTKKTRTSRKSSRKSAKTGKYKVRKGDTLSAISKKKLGKAGRWTEIYRKNKSIIEKTAKKHGRRSSSNGYWIYPGTTLTIPAK